MVMSDTQLVAAARGVSMVMSMAVSAVISMAMSGT